MSTFTPPTLGRVRVTLATPAPCGLATPVVGRPLVPGLAGRPLANVKRAQRLATRATVDDEPAPDGDDDIEAARDALTRLMETDTHSITGRELRDLVFAKWGKLYDVRIQRRGPRMFLHVMWKHLEQKSFPLTEEEYQEQLDAVADLVSAWGAGDVVRNGIAAAHHKGPGYTVGGGAKAISIPLPVDMVDV